MKYIKSYKRRLLSPNSYVVSTGVSSELIKVLSIQYFSKVTS